MLVVEAVDLSAVGAGGKSKKKKGKGKEKQEELEDRWEKLQGRFGKDAHGKMLMVCFAFLISRFPRPKNTTNLGGRQRLRARSVLSWRMVFASKST